MTLAVKKLWVFVAIGQDKDGKMAEGLCAFRAADGTWMPLLASDKTRLTQLRPIAQDIANASGQEIKLVEFKRVRESTLRREH